MVTARTSPLKHFPALLKRRPTKELSEHERREAFRALLEHYKLKTDFDAINGLRRKTFDRAQAEALLFAKLAKLLVRDFVPAYWPASGRRGRRKKADVVGGSFGGLLAAPDYSTRVYQAQLVELVDHIKNKKQKSQTWAFAWLVKSKNRSCLPALYRDLKEASSLKQAFKKIPKPVREDPTAYLQRTSPSTTAFLSGNLRFSPAIKTVRGLLS